MLYFKQFKIFYRKNIKRKINCTLPDVRCRVFVLEGIKSQSLRIVSFDRHNTIFTNQYHD